MSQGCINILPQNEVYKDIFDESNSILVSGDAERIANSIIERDDLNSTLKMKRTAREFVERKANLDHNTQILIDEYRDLLTTNLIKKNFINKIILLSLMAVYFFDQFLFIGLRNKFRKIYN